MHYFIIPMLSWTLVSSAGSVTVLCTVGGPLAKYGSHGQRQEEQKGRRGSKKRKCKRRCGRTSERSGRTLVWSNFSKVRPNLQGAVKAVSNLFSAILQERSNLKSSTKQGSGRFVRTYTEFDRTYPESDRTYPEFGRTFSRSQPILYGLFKVLLRSFFGGEKKNSRIVFSKKDTLS